MNLIRINDLMKFFTSDEFDADAREKYSVTMDGLLGFGFELFNEIQNLKKEFDTHNEKFASRIVDSIVGYYLNYNRCDHVLRAKLCTLCDLSQQQALIATQRNLLN